MTVRPMLERQGQDATRYVLRLYVTGLTPRSQRAIGTIKAICEHHLKDRYSLEIIDLFLNPALAEAVAGGIALMSQAADALKAAYGNTSPPRPDSAAAAPDGAECDAADLARRIAALEQRLAALEAGIGGAGGGTAPKPRRRRT